MRTIWIPIIILATGCDCKEANFDGVSTVTCNSIVKIKNPDCVSMLDKLVPSANAIAIHVPVAAVAGSIAAQQSARRERERKKLSCDSSPVVERCAQWLVVAGRVWCSRDVPCMDGVND